MLYQSKLSDNQVGAISIYVSITVMLVMMIIGVSFHHIITNNFRNTVDKQLNLEAQYAAETGLLDGRKIVNAYFQSMNIGGSPLLRSSTSASGICKPGVPAETPLPTTQADCLNGLDNLIANIDLDNGIWDLVNSICILGSPAETPLPTTQADCQDGLDNQMSAYDLDNGIWDSVNSICILGSPAETPLPTTQADCQDGRDNKITVNADNGHWLPATNILQQLGNIPSCLNSNQDIPNNLKYKPQGSNLSPQKLELDFALDDQRVGYSCLDIELDPDVLYWDKVDYDKSINVILKPILDEPDIDQANPREDNVDVRMGKLRIKWRYTDKAKMSEPNRSWNPSAGWPKLPAEDDWNGKAPLLRVLITPFDADGFSRKELLAYTKTYYLYPSNGQNPSAIKYDNPNNNVLNANGVLRSQKGGHKSGYIAQARCSNTKDGCVAIIKNLPHFIDDDTSIDTTGGNREDNMQFLISISSYYGEANVELKGYKVKADIDQIWDEQADLLTDCDNLAAVGLDPQDIRSGVNCRFKFKDIQATIKATGYAGDVKVRLEERIPLQRPFYGTPYNSVNSVTSICKTLVGDPTVGTTTYNKTVFAPATGIDKNVGGNRNYFGISFSHINKNHPDTFDNCDVW